MEFWITGDTHGNFSRFTNCNIPIGDGIIILGDVGFNFYLNKTDKKNKTHMNESGYDFYCVRGNHEQRPELIPGMKKVYHEDIAGWVYEEAEWPHIHYLMDGGIYQFGRHKCLVIGGAYSVDKWYRLGEEPEDTIKWTGWFKDEQLTNEERTAILSSLDSVDKIDFVLTHTCPIEWEPTDLFLSMVIQKQIDRTMENFLSDVRAKIRGKYGVWCFGHYHADRIERPYAEMFYKDIVNMSSVEETWNEYEMSGLPWYAEKSPHFYMTD